MALHTQSDAAVHFNQLIAYGKADIRGGAVDFSSLMIGGDATLTVGNLDAGTLMTGVDFSLSGSDNIVLHKQGSLFITADKGIKVGQIASGGNIELFASNDIYYDQIIGYSTATLTSLLGGLVLRMYCLSWGMCD